MANGKKPLPGRGAGTSILETDVIGRDDMRYHGKKLSDPINTADDKWRLLPAFLQTRGLIKQHIDSFNYFCEVDIKNIMRASREVRSDVDPTFFLRFRDIRVQKPAVTDHHTAVGYELTPHECRLRDVTYAGSIFVDIEYVRGKTLVRQSNIEIARMPIMLKSSRCILTGKAPAEVAAAGECPLDPGGYFIIRGTEKVILIQEQLSKNRIIVETDRVGCITANVTSSTHEKKSKTYVAITKTGRAVVRHNSFQTEVPLPVVLKAMGIESDRGIAELVCGYNKDYLDLFAPTLEGAAGGNTSGDGVMVRTQQEALEWLSGRIRIPMRFGGPPKDRIEEVKDLLATTLLAHIPIEMHHGVPSYQAKAVYLGVMTRRCLQAIKNGGLVDDRDFVGNKRLELAGQLLSLLFEDLFRSWCSTLKRAVDMGLKKTQRTNRFEPKLVITQTSRFITDGLFRAISSGNWNVKRFKMERSGVTQVLSRLSYVSALGMLTRIASQFEKTRKVSGPRSLQTSQWGMLCPSDTPEGEACGLIKNLALMAHITIDTDDAALRRLLLMLGTVELTTLVGTDLFATAQTYLVFLNGVIVGVHHQPRRLLRQFRRLRRAGRVPPLVSVYLSTNHQTINISSDGGRVCRPLIVVERGRPLITALEVQDIIQGHKTFDDLINEGKIEFLDVNEETDANIAITEADIVYHPEESALFTKAAQRPDLFTDVDLIPLNTTHLEIAPFTVLGAVAGLIPYPHHNQSPRNTYQCAMGKQAIGAIAYNQLRRIDTLLYLMVYTQQPMVRTRTIEMIGYDKVPAGQTATVAVMSYSGYDIEDALVLNKGALDRGFGRCQVMRKFATQIKTYANHTFDRIGDAQYDAKGVVLAKFAALEVDGIAAVGEKIRTGQIYVNKQSPIDSSLSSGTHPGEGGGVQTIQFKPCPGVYKYPGDYSVVDQVCITRNEEDQMIIKTLIRQTRRPELGDKFSSRHGQKGVCGIIVNAEDMPFADSGVMPDIIMNPHGFPSRMTVGKMIELLAGKAGVLKGELQYGTCFGGSKVEDMSRILIQHGYSYSGKDYVTSGITGEPLQAYIFFGPIYYQKLKHMVMDKMHARSRGPRATLTRQPTEGRSREGGLRVGEMERDCLIGHGTASLLIERLLYSSDVYDMQVCQECGLIGGWQGYCPYCKHRSGVASVKVPYACKLLFQEMMAMNVVPRVRVGPL